MGKRECDFCGCPIDVDDVIVRHEDDSNETEVYCTADCYLLDNNIGYYTYTGKGDDDESND